MIPLHFLPQDLVYHNGVSDNDCPEGDHPPPAIGNGDASLSPQRNQSFISAVLNAIKNAAITAKSTVNKTNGTNVDHQLSNIDASDTTDMLDSETEPCLMMENVLEDIPMPDSHSHNMISSSYNSRSTCSPLRLTDGVSSTMNKDDESLYNLCQAIANRQEIEHQTSLMLQVDRNGGFQDDAKINESTSDLNALNESCSTQALVGQIIDVDNSMTRLLKIWRIIQTEDSNCIQKLIGEKYAIQYVCSPNENRTISYVSVIF